MRFSGNVIDGAAREGCWLLQIQAVKQKWVKQMGIGQEKAREALAQVQKVVLGKRRQVEEIFLAFLADGHVLLEDIPGVGKTTLAKAFARDFWLVSGSCLFCFLLSLPVLLDYHRLRCRDKLRRADCREVYAGMMKLLYDAGYFLDMEGWERAFPEMAAEVFPEVTEEELRRQQKIPAVS